MDTFRSNNANMSFYSHIYAQQLFEAKFSSMPDRNVILHVINFGFIVCLHLESIAGIMRLLLINQAKIQGNYSVHYSYRPLQYSSVNRTHLY